MRAKFLGYLAADGTRQDRRGFTVGEVYIILGEEPGVWGPRYSLRDDDGDLRRRPQDDFEVLP